MSRFRKNSFLIIIAEILIIAVMNFALISNKIKKDDYYKVEAERVVRLLEKDEEIRQNPEQIDLSGFDSLIRVRLYKPSEACNNEYVVEEAGGKLWRIEYENKDDNPILFMNIGMGAAFVLTVLLLLYIDKNVLSPFGKMTELPVELAKGNLSMPIKEEKSRFFGKYLWGMNMLREKLEDSKNKNLEYQKEKKTLLLSLSHDIKTPLAAIQL